MPGIAALDAATHIADMIRAALAQPFHSSSGEVVVSTISVGVAVARPDASRPPEHLIAAADRAMYAAKRQGRNRVCVAPADP